MIERIKNLKKGESVVYHVGHLVRDAVMIPEIANIKKFVMSVMYDIEFSVIKNKKKCRYHTVQRKMHGTKFFEYEIKRVR